MVAGKILRGADNNSFMHETYPHCCKTCGYPVKQEVNPGFRLKQKRYDVSYTYDGYLIVSEKFKNYCTDMNFKNIVFEELPMEPGFYVVTVHKIITLNYTKREVKFIDKCDECGRYAEVIGATPSFIDDESELKDSEFYRSDMDFGSYERKSPLIIMNNNLANKITIKRFKGLYLKNVLKS